MHLVGFKAALTRTINSYANANDLREEADQRYGGDESGKGRPRARARKV